MEIQSIAEVKAVLEWAREVMDRLGEETATPIAEVLEDEHLAILARLNKLCGHKISSEYRENGDDSHEDNGEDVREEELLPIRKKRKLTAKAIAIIGGPNDPWKRITNPANFERLPEVPKYIQIHIRKYGNDASKFLRTLALVSECGEYLSSDNLGDAFMVRYEWTNRVNRRDEQIRVLQLFNNLFWFDIMQCLRPRGSGRVGGVMLEELDAFLTPLHFQSVGLKKQEVIKNVGEWSLFGAKINKLCRIYGPGVILVLHKELSHHFLESRFTASGPYFKGAIKRLDTLDLRQWIADNGLGNLAENVRELMIKPFREAIGHRPRLPSSPNSAVISHSFD